MKRERFLSQLAKVRAREEVPSMTAFGRHVGVCSSEGSGVIVARPLHSYGGDGRSPTTLDVECDHRHAALAE